MSIFGIIYESISINTKIDITITANKECSYRRQRDALFLPTSVLRLIDFGGAM